MSAVCFFGTLPGAGPCDGELVRCHLIPKQRIKRQLRLGRSRADLDACLWDERCWVWGCGGAMGIGGHHGALDYSRSLRVPRGLLPAALEEFAAEHGLAWSLDRDYGVRVGTASAVVPLDPVGHLQARQLRRGG